MINSYMKRKTKACSSCGRMISLSNYRRHTNSCKGLIVKKNTYNRYDWNEIQKSYDSGLSYRGLSDKYGMCQQTLAKAMKRGDLKTRSVSDGLKEYYKEHEGTRMSEDNKNILSKRMSEHNHGGRCKWFKVDGKSVQGTWERDFALYCNDHQIEWTRCKSIKYVINGVSKNYTPDFHIPEYDTYVEIKGHWWGNDKEKMDCVIDQHDDKDFLIIEKQDFENLMNNKVSLMELWCKLVSM